jgi:hypothetical protein
MDTPGAPLAAVGSRSIDSAPTFAKDFGTPSCYGSYEALAEASDVDIIDVARRIRCMHKTRCWRSTAAMPYSAKSRSR